MNTYLLLQVIEERAVTRFPLFEAAFRPVDRETADTFAAVARDEERHLKYCHAIARRYAPDARTHATTLAHYRRAEASVFTETSSLNMSHILSHNLVRLTPAQRLAWTAFGTLVRSIGAQARTRYWSDAPVAA